ncbi:hypothetical protein [Domibacillus indicus]|uniref:hypothetical protein n=1 Tax=Domibacillus indicus TaxID=1437523 RepID=UPI0006180A5F|nr:hypothetical protein [Domibacillus indicus]
MQETSAAGIAYFTPKKRAWYLFRIYVFGQTEQAVALAAFLAFMYSTLLSRLAEKRDGPLWQA